MTTNELAAELNTLTVPELKKVALFVAKLKRNRKTTFTMPRYSKQKLISIIEESYNQSQNGSLKPINSFLAEIREEYGLSI